MRYTRTIFMNITVPLSCSSLRRLCTEPTHVRVNNMLLSLLGEFLSKIIGISSSGLLISLWLQS